MAEGVYVVFSQPIEEVSHFNLNYWRTHFEKLLARCTTGDLRYIAEAKRLEYEECARQGIERIDAELKRRMPQLAEKIMQCR